MTTEMLEGTTLRKAMEQVRADKLPDNPVKILVADDEHLVASGLAANQGYAAT